MLLNTVVSTMGGRERAGQLQMAQAVEAAVDTQRHLLVQAGTGTGKSLAYLVPAVAHAFATGKPAVVATATLALQSQIVDGDLPRLAEALRPTLGREPTCVLVKGRRNYVCRYKTDGGLPDDDEGTLLSVGEVDKQSSWLGKEVLRLREWAGQTDSGDRDELVPGVSERAWHQVSVSARECLGGACPVRDDCFVEIARARAQDVDVVVTNHSFMAIDAFEGRQLLPEHDLLVVDEAHELVDRVTATITDELTSGMVESAARKAGRLADTAELVESAEALRQALESLPEGRLRILPEELAQALGSVLESSRDVQSQLKADGSGKNDPGSNSDRLLARSAVEEIFEVCDRILAGREIDVLWSGEDLRRGMVLRVAPLSVAMMMREKVFQERTVVLTSATLELGGSFDSVAGVLGLQGEDAPHWDGLDVGSPFDYRRQAMAYVARHVPAPTREGASPVAMDEIEALIRSAGGRTLGLFSSMRAARATTEEMRERLGEDYPILCQGDDQTPTLVREFASDARTCLFGTLSLWQGVDVPGSACQLVIIDRIPFPRPDDPLASARSEEVSRRGGNGFMAVSATHAALRLAQGVGRLIRRDDDRGVVAFLDSRMLTARYAGFLQSSLPPFWATTDRELVLGALDRLDRTAAPVVPLRERS
nr:ATP-dependent DNA helicase [Austwickia chelonae]